MTKEAIILAGGFGTRLASVVDVPKPMAPINDIPFLEYILNYLEKHQVTKIHLAVGYKYQVIVDYFGSQFKNCQLNYVIEDSPLGTGGAIKKALAEVESDRVFIINGDTFFDVDLSKMDAEFNANNATVSLALKPMKNFDRYGVVEVDATNKILAFKEKQHCKSGAINGGIYLLKTNIFDGLDFPEQFSLEQDYFDIYCTQTSFFGFISDTYFIDIGIPTDYAKAQEELPSLLG
ncbi:MAG: nucleotidyltransferase family protein [Vicingaceae bacterium]|nr:nucleotidyltransferase family protein [Vicingaceae bacterium]